MTVYQIPSKTTEGRTYTVDLVAGTCNCTAGTHRQPCTHIASAFLMERENMTGPAAVREAERITSPDVWKQLREPFPESQIGKLPKNVNKDGQPGDCDICKGYHKWAAVHLDYVGHAEVTDRLLRVDPLWNWEPMGVTADGLPAFTMSGNRPVGLWIRLTIGGVTRLGYGSVESGKFDAEKELIGDAIRNAAMRFGVALDLWAKSDLHAAANEDDRQAPPLDPPRGHLAQAAQAMGGKPADEPDPETRATPPLDPTPEARWKRLSALMASEKVTTEPIKTVLGGKFGSPALEEWLAAEAGRTPEMLIDYAKAEANRKRGGAPFA